jgi:hypothetical protein
MEQQKINDLEKAILVAYDCLLNNDVETAKEILINQIEKIYEQN